MFYLILFVLELLILGILSGKVKMDFWRILLKLTKSEKTTGYLYALFFLPGTFIHEVSHFLFALILLVPVGKLELSPVIEDKKLKLGSVSVANTDIIRSTIIGMAPLITGIGIIIFSLYQIQSGFFVWTKLFTYLLAVYLVFEVGNTMFLSRSDAKSGMILLIALVIFYAVLYVAGVRINVQFDKFIYNYREVFKKAVLFLIIPIVLDLLVYTLFSALKSNRVVR